MSLPGGRAAILLGLGIGLQAGMAHASAWPMAKGEGQVIAKFEAMRAKEAYDPDGRSFDLLGERRDRAVSVLTEYGLSDRVTLQIKGEWQSGRDGQQSFEGRGPIEIGARWAVFQGEKSVVSLYGGYSQSGDTRNAGYADTGQGERDVEFRILAGRGGERLFAEVQAARRLRDGLPDETRMDLTLGYHANADWMVMGQVYMGVTDDNASGFRALWTTSEISAVRRFGPWNGQAGWRSSLAGRSTPDAHGPVLAIWRRF